MHIVPCLGARAERLVKAGVATTVLMLAATGPSLAQSIGFTGYVGSRSTNAALRDAPSLRRGNSGVDRVMQVGYEGGSFRFIGGNSWVERNGDGIFHYAESGHFLTGIRLWDAQRRVVIALDLANMRVISTGEGERPSALYQITTLK